MLTHSPHPSTSGMKLVCGKDMSPTHDVEAPAQELPPDVIAVLLTFVSPGDLLTSCAFVCKAWHTASCSSISSMNITCFKQRHAHNAFRWLTKHGRGVTSVRMTVSESAQKLCLDCDLQAWRWLKDLRLTGFNLRQGPSPADFAQYTPDIAALMARSALVQCKSSSRLAELTSLTRLDLDGCAVPDDLVALSQLTGLEHLTISVMTHDPTGVSCKPFQTLSKLTYLHIGVDVCDSTCSHLSSLVSLKELHISKYAAISSSGLTQIGALQQLTHLRVNCASYVIDLNSVPGFSALSGLKHLEVIDSKELNPAVLGALTGLEHLALVDTAINPRGVSPSAAQGVLMLLALLAQMQQLTFLNLTDCLNWPQPVQAYSALTASPKLAKLIVRYCHFPGGICDQLYAIREGRVRTQLTQLVVHTNWPGSVTLAAGDVVKMAGCCPRLKQLLDVDFGKQSPEQLMPLKRVSSLTLVTINDISDAGLEVIAQLSTLRHLDIERAKAVTAQGLSKLTALHGLTQLRAAGSACVFGGHHHCRLLQFKSKTGQEAPDVWNQLQRLLQDNARITNELQRFSSSGGGSSSCGGIGGSINRIYLQAADRSRRGELAELRQLLIATEAFWGH